MNSRWQMADVWFVQGGYPGQLPWWPLPWWPLPWWSLLGGVPWSTSMTTSGGWVPCDLSHNAVHVISALLWPLPSDHFHDHFWGVLCDLSHNAFHVISAFQTPKWWVWLGAGGDHFWGVLCDLSHNAVHVISALQTPKWWVWLGAHAYIVLPQRIVERLHGNPPPPPGQIDRQTQVNTLPSRTTWLPSLLFMLYLKMLEVINV